MRYPNTLDKNVYIAYINKSQKIESGNLNSSELNWDLNIPETLRELCLKFIAENCVNGSICNQLIVPDDKFFLIDMIDCNIALQICINIQEDSFWKRMFLSKYKNHYTNTTKGKKWIQIFLELHLSETLQKLKPSEYRADNIKQLLEICNPFIERLKVNYLEPSLSEVTDHIPFEIILSNLTELKVLDLTYDCKTIEKNFYLGCSALTENDIKYFVKGLERCYELREFRFHSSKLEPHMLKLIAKALDKGCTNLTTIALPHCRFGDAGLNSFLDCLNYESFPKLESIILTNNFISEGVVRLACLLKRRKIKHIDLRLNPISSFGAAAIFGIINYVELENLNLSSCSFDDSIGNILLYLIKNNRTLESIHISNNKIGHELGEKILEALKKNPHIKYFDIRNCDILHESKCNIDLVILGNRDSNPLANLI